MFTYKFLLPIVLGLQFNLAHADSKQIVAFSHGTHHELSPTLFAHLSDNQVTNLELCNTQGQCELMLPADAQPELVKAFLSKVQLSLRNEIYKAKHVTPAEVGQAVGIVGLTSAVGTGALSALVYLLDGAPSIAAAKRNFAYQLGAYTVLMTAFKAYTHYVDHRVTRSISNALDGRMQNPVYLPPASWSRFANMVYHASHDVLIAPAPQSPEAHEVIESDDLADFAPHDLNQ